jgi:hypothetical protein
LSPERTTKARARLKQCDDTEGWPDGIEGWRKAVASIASSPWLLGRNDADWKASFSFMLQRESFTKVLEGIYVRAPRSMM